MRIHILINSMLLVSFYHVVDYFFFTNYFVWHSRALNIVAKILFSLYLRFFQSFLCFVCFLLFKLWYFEWLENIREIFNCPMLHHRILIAYAYCCIVSSSLLCTIGFARFMLYTKKFPLFFVLF